MCIRDRYQRRVHGELYAFNQYKNTEVRLEDDFYEAINKEWLSKTKLDDGCVSYGTFQEVSAKVNYDVKNIIKQIKENASQYDINSEEIKILNLYEQYQDIVSRDSLGIKPIKKYIDMAEDIKSLEDIKQILRNQDFSYFQFLVNFGVGSDCKDSTNNILYIGNSKLALGNSYYYNKDIVKKPYIDYITKLNILSGLDDEKAKEYARKFYNIEKQIASKIPTKQEETFNENTVESRYNLYTIKQLEKEYPNIQFTKLLKKFKLNNAKKIVIDNPQGLKKVNDLINKDNIEDIKVFFRTSVLLRSDNSLTTEFREASSELKKILYGINSMEINENEAVKFTMSQLQELVGKLYINKYFDYKSKEDVEELAKDIISNFQNRLDKNAWMSEITKKEAKKKLNNIKVKIGYPNKWNDYSKLEIKTYENNGDLISNLISIYNYEAEREFLKINKTGDREEWNMGACVVNAYYNPINNEIVFPAAILQPPFYDKESSKEKNLGGIGVIIGHELTHAFDNTCLLYTSPSPRDRQKSRMPSSA
eukprot:TRINITY_DN21803_c0_g2_i2.p1 TRINITY_DN21803_c0_g2~~TRINITY_DN21803_c0_g2_i2.p1  ORF type:complete len:535 (+),score=97.60 TRINITY_DN21803_c0_g2_i2:164-1768(+)